MTNDKEYYRRNLPHWQPQDCINFVTFRLANSLPERIIKELIGERNRERQAVYQISEETQRKNLLSLHEKKYFGRFDAWLDRCMEESSRWLTQESIARHVMAEIHRLDGEQYQVIAYCIMPNHVHLLINIQGYAKDPHITPRTGIGSYPLTRNIRLLKGRTARSCNQILGRTGSFWHHESYDHVVRDEQECVRIIRYILDNPVKAGLVTDWRQWPYTYLYGNIELDK